MTEHRLDPLLKPGSIALLGASDRSDSPGHVLARHVIESDYPGEVYPVNPRCETIMGQTCYPDLAALPSPVDHVIIALGNDRLEKALGYTIAYGARAATIYSSAVLAEDSQPGLRSRLQSMAAEAGLAICGVNGMGFYNLGIDLFAGIFPRAAHIERGGISYIAQSGSAFTTLCHNGSRLGFNLCVSSGTEISVTTADYMDWALAQPDTRVIGLFLETVRDPVKFVEALAKARAQDVPVVVLKIGKTQMAQQMALSHTGAIAGDQAAFEALFRRYDVISVEDFDEMAAVLMLLQSGREAGDGEFAAVFESGGFRELITDQAEDLGVSFAGIEADTAEAMIPHLDPGLKAENPLDAWGSHANFEARFEACLRLLMDDPQVAGGAFFSNYRDGYYIHEAIFDAVWAVSRHNPKPIALITCFSDLAHPEMCRRAYEAGLPLIDGSREGLLAFKRLFAYQRGKNRTDIASLAPLSAEKVESWRDYLHARQAPTISEYDALRMLADFGIAAAQGRAVASEAELIDAAAELGYPLVLKTNEAGIDHKSDVGGVVIGIEDEEELVEDYRDIASRLGPSALVVPMVDDGVEIALGTVNDPQFGPIVMVAAGGVLVELLADRALALCPVAPPEAAEMLESLKIDKLLRGARGKPPVERESLVQAIVTLSQIASELRDEIAEIDINPVIARDTGTTAVDALIVRRD